MLDFFFHIIDEIVGGFTRNVSWHVLLNTYWFLFFVEFPRYYLLEILVTCWHKLHYRERKEEKTIARMKLYIALRFPSVAWMVCTGFLPGGSSSITDTSRSPYRVMARVRGLGVAVITST